VSAAPDLFTAVTAEDWLVSRLSALGHPLDPALAHLPLKGRLRELITSAGIACVIAGRGPSGKGVETLEEAFARIYGQALEPKPIRKTRSTQRKVTA
jgi:hypothetical protein